MNYVFAVVDVPSIVQGFHLNASSFPFQLDLSAHPFFLFIYFYENKFVQCTGCTRK